MKFTIDDGTDVRSIETVSIPKAVQRVIAYLDGLEEGKLVNAQKLSMVVGILKGTLANHLSHPALAPYKVAHRYNLVYYGNPATVQAYKAEMEKKDER